MSPCNRGLPRSQRPLETGDDGAFAREVVVDDIQVVALRPGRLRTALGFLGQSQSAPQKGHSFHPSWTGFLHFGQSMGILPRGFASRWSPFGSMHNALAVEVVDHIPDGLHALSLLVRDLEGLLLGGELLLQTHDKLDQVQ